MKEKLTERQARVLDYIRGFIKRQGYPPSQIQIAAMFRVQRTTIIYHCQQLIKKGHLRKERNLFVPMK